MDMINTNGCGVVMEWTYWEMSLGWVDGLVDEVSDCVEELL
jgi:hypothetical protein